MIEVFSLLIVLVMSLIITRVATVALTLTGLTRQTAQFQARSALTGAGYTTDESERVVNHPMRRRIIMWLMLTGNTGLVLVASLMVVMLAGGDDKPLLNQWQQIALLVGGLVMLYVVARSNWVERYLAAAIERVLRRYTDVGRRDYAGLMRLSGDYSVVELSVADEDWVAGRTLEQLKLSREGILVLGVARQDGRYVGAPRADTTIDAGDTLLLYGRDDVLDELDERRSGIGGQLRHNESVARQQERQAQEKAEDDSAQQRDEQSDKQGEKRGDASR